MTKTSVEEHLRRNLDAQARRDAKKERFWVGDVNEVDDFGKMISNEFIDGRTKMGPWAIMTPNTWDMHGIGQLGIGYGQRYQKTVDGKWRKVEG
jgi:hypothetical protein